jgi:hypothetical protein
MELWYLNGVKVPRWLAETPEGKIHGKRFAEIQNAEVRREFVRKVGVERIISDCGAVELNRMGDYTLYEVDLGGRTGKWPYLRMLNPSIGTWHVECVGRGCRTVEAALAWRNNDETYIAPEVLT